MGSEVSNGQTSSSSTSNWTAAAKKSAADYARQNSSVFNQQPTTKGSHQLLGGGSFANMLYDPNRVTSFLTASERKKMGSENIDWQGSINQFFGTTGLGRGLLTTNFDPEGKGAQAKEKYGANYMQHLLDADA